MPVPYPIALENVERRYPWYVMKSHAVAGTPFSSSTPKSDVEEPCHLGPSCTEKTLTCPAVMDRRHRFQTINIRDGVSILGSSQEPYGQWVNQPVPPPPQVSPLTIPLEYL